MALALQVGAAGGGFAGRVLFQKFSFLREPFGPWKLPVQAAIAAATSLGSLD